MFVFQVQDDAVCRQCLRQIQDVLSESVPATKKFEQLVSQMLKFEEDDWEKMSMKYLAAHAAALGQVAGVPGNGGCSGLPAFLFSGGFPGALAPSSPTPST